MKYCSSSLVCVTRPPPPTTTTAARRSSSSRRRRRQRQQLWQLKMWNSQGRQLALKFDLQWHTMRLSSSAIYGFYLWLHFYYTVQKEALMGYSHWRCTPPCPYSWQPPATTLLATVILILPTSLTTQDSTAYSMFELGGAFRDHSLWDRCLCIAVSWEFEHYVQFLCILVLRYEIPLRYGYDVSRSLFPFLYLWLSVHTGGKLSDWLQLNYSVVHYQLECISGIETNGLLEMTKVVISFVRNDDKYIF